LNFEKILPYQKAEVEKQTAKEPEKISTQLYESQKQAFPCLSF